jgi:hypothetical protein
MSVYSGPEIPNNGLVLALDAANARSYSASVPTFSNFTTPARMNGSSSISRMLGVAVSSTGRFVAVGSNGLNPNLLPVYSTSTDGTTWTTPANMPGSENCVMESVAVNSSGLFVAVGYNVGGDGAAMFSTSTNGTTWTTPARMNGSTTLAQMYDVAVDSSGRFVAIGSVGGVGQSYFATSTNGTTWTTPATISGGSVTGPQMFSVAVNSSGLFVAVGYDSGNTGIYATSTNGTTWSAPTRMPVTSARLQGIAVNSSGLFVAVGAETGGAPIYTTSANGSTWATPARMNGSATIAFMQDIAVDSSGRFVAVGRDNAPVFATSTNGTTWTTPARMNGSSTAAFMEGVAVNSSGLFVAVGRDSSDASLACSVFATSTTINSSPTTWTDLSGVGNNGTLINGPTYNSANGGALVFDGVDDAVDCGGNSSIKPTTSITVSTWIKFNGATGNNRVLSDWHQAGGGGDRWIFYTPTSTAVVWYMTSNGQGESGTTGYNFTLGEWVNLTGTYNQSQQILYVNGVQYSAIARTGTLYAGDSSQTVRIGRQAEAGSTHNGLISNVQIYNRALSAEEVQQNFAAFRGRYGI